jgi:recombination protein RecR
VVKLQEIDNLSNIISRLPSLGPRSAKRIVLHLIKNREYLIDNFISCLNDIKHNIRYCDSCHNLSNIEICNICANARRDHKIICVVEDVTDLWAIERSKIYNGLYHILGGTLSAISGVAPEDLKINSLIKRIAAGGIEEIIIATNATIEGKTTSYYLVDQIKHYNIRISQPAYGIPIGGEFDYLDDGTLIAALNARHDLVNG